MKKLAVLIGMGMAVSSFAAEVVKTCDVGRRMPSNIALVRDGKIASTHIYYLRQAGKRLPLFGSREMSRGEAVVAHCVGAKYRALIVSGEFTANALQGAALTKNPETGALERLDFAEKSRPLWFYLGREDMMIVVPTSGYGEHDAAYGVYRHVFGEGASDQATGVDHLPPVAGYDVQKLSER